MRSLFPTQSNYQKGAEMKASKLKLTKLLLNLVLGLSPHLMVLSAHAKLLVKVNEPKRTGAKTVVNLQLKNTFDEKVESARAQIFLLDDQGKVVGQSVQWLLGGTKDKLPLAPGAS